MDQNLNSESLLRTTTSPQKRKVVLQSILWGFVLLVIFFSAWFLFFIIKNQGLLTEKSGSSSREDEYQRTVETAYKLMSLYAGEVAPLVIEGESSTAVLAENSSTSESVSGTFMFTGVMKGNRLAPYVQVYSLDLSDVKNKPTVLYTEHKFNGMVEFKDTKNLSTAFLLTASSSLQRGKDIIGVHLFSSQSNTLQSFESTNGENERNFVWSEKAGLLALNRSKENKDEYVDLLPLENWETIVVDPETDSVVLTIEGAYQPKWSPDGAKLIYLKSDGLYSFDLQTKNANKIISVPKDGQVVATSMIDLSPDGTSLIWTTAKLGIISLFEVTSWDTPTVLETGRIQIPATEVYWPIFSPDGTQYAVQAIDVLKIGDEERQNPRIEIRPVTGRNPIFKYSLAEFDFDQLFSDVWVK